MEDSSLNSPSGDSIREAGRLLFVALARANREIRGELRATRQLSERLALASVEALELVTDTVAGLQNTLDPAVRHTLDAALTGAADKLTHAGIEFEGAAGESVDPARHKVVRSTAPSGRLPNRVRTVWRPGVLFGGQRVRQAEVAAEYAEGFDDTNRH